MTVAGWRGVFPRVLLVDRDPAVVRAWRRAFVGLSTIEVRQADYFDEPADAMVSPANSLGIMDGGIDLAIRETLGVGIECRLRTLIEARHHGEQPIGCAEVVATGHARWPFLISAPTMRVPEKVPHSLNAYWAFRAVLLAVRRHNQAAVAPPIRSIVCCGLATGTGRMPPMMCAVQMRQAWLLVTGSSALPRVDHLLGQHRAMQETTSHKDEGS